MSKQIKLSWKDEANNETIHRIYRGDSLLMTAESSVLIAELEWDGTQWNESVIDSGINTLTKISDGGDPVSTGQTFEVEFIDTLLGEHYYGVSAGNAVADSDVVASSSSILID
jgi:hypothetical protein